MGVPSEQDYRVLAQARGRERLHEVLAGRTDLHRTVSEVVTSGQPYVEILRVAAQQQSNLIVMGGRTDATVSTPARTPDARDCENRRAEAIRPGTLISTAVPSFDDALIRIDPSRTFRASRQMASPNPLPPVRRARDRSMR